MLPLHSHNVLFGISGGIAAYKTPDLVRKLTALGANVRVVLTDSAKSFVSPLSLQAVSGHTVSDDLLDPAAEAAMGHIELAKWADSVLVAPATANIMAKITHGLADDLLTTLCLATAAPIYLAPAMNQQMWRAPATQANLAILQARGIICFGPAAGEQACGDVGPGRMLEPELIAQLLADQQNNAADKPEKPLLAGKKVMITAGPTRESIDPVRYISNHSSGKMGYALAQAAQQLGAQVCLVSGPVNLATPAGVERIDVQSAQQMHDAVLKSVESYDVFVACAAVADYRPKDLVPQKIKKKDTELTLTFVKNPDILSDVGHLANPPFTLGFAAETQQVAEYAKDKMRRKKLNMIAANDVSQPGIGFNSDENALQVFWPEGELTLATADKNTLAMQLMTLTAEKLEQQNA